jgi:hypothetical protein
VEIVEIEGWKSSEADAGIGGKRWKKSVSS